MKKENVEIDAFTLLTGATGGLGKAFAKALIEKGHKNLILSSTNIDKLTSLRNELLGLNKNLNILTFPCDLSNEKSRDEFFKFLKEKNAQISMLINNAGYICEGSIRFCKEETIKKAIRVNCEGTLAITKFVLDNSDVSKLKIITISSMAGDYPMPYMAIYSATKSFLTSYFLALRQEYKKDGLKVLIVKPGAIATSEDMIKAIEAQGLKGRLSSVKPEIIAKKSLKLAGKNKATFTPGFFNKMTEFFSLFVTKNFEAKLVGSMWKKSQEKRDIK